MGKRIRQISMKTVFIRYLLMSGTFVCLLLSGAFTGVILLQNRGILYRADAGAQVSMEAMPIVRQMSLDTFEEEKLPQLCRFAVFSKGGADEPVLTNMDDRYLAAAMNAWKGGSGNLGYIQYHIFADMEDGAVCLLQFDYAVHYVDPRLDRMLPDFQTALTILLLALIIAGIWLITRHYARRISRETAILVRAGARIYNQDLSDQEGERAGIREFAQAMKTLDGMKKELEQSLNRQWRMRQERNDSIAALAHDLKTPLTVIGGNAELLKEERLSEEQKLCVEMILRNVSHAQRYLDKLRICVSEEEYTEAVKRVEPAAFYAECCRVGEALCREKRIRFNAAEYPLRSGVSTAPIPVCPDGSEEESFEGYPEELLRAITNILENAVRYTPLNGQIFLAASREEEKIMFTVQDTGPGFSQEALKKAGNMLYTSDGSRPREGHQGMGLYFARRIAQKHGGTVTVSNTAQGGCVTLMLQRRAGRT